MMILLFSLEVEGRQATMRVSGKAAAILPRQPDPGDELNSREGGKARARDGAKGGKKGGCLHPSPACQSVTEGENDRPQWGPSEPG